MAQPRPTISEVEEYYAAAGVRTWEGGYTRPARPEATFVIDSDYSPINKVFGAVLSVQYVAPIDGGGVGATLEEPRGCFCEPVPLTMPELKGVEGEILTACCALDNFIAKLGNIRDVRRSRAVLRMTYRVFRDELTPKARFWLQMLRDKLAENNVELVYRTWRTACRHRPQGELDTNSPSPQVGAILPASALLASRNSLHHVPEQDLRGNLGPSQQT